MLDLAEAFRAAVRQIATLNPQLIEIIALSLKVTLAMARKDLRRTVLLDEQHVVLIEPNALLHPRSAHWHSGDR
jgi:hypothetical protein